MQIAVLIEQNSEHRFVASGAAPFSISVEANTPEEAIALLKAKIAEQVAQGATVTTIEVQTTNPWLAGAGMFREDPLYSEWQQEIAEYRSSQNQTVDEIGSAN